ncbi:helix-turn-helix domain-containing protein [Ramlibacter sp. WS9]|uniref:helix-turn-helix domain-containing protein n=1 Tax=Ramlibacter sp. WS9 TaxID=1882741 RepID=UPI0011446FA9|nr:helix-turn-helix domain-containing protein [Ramlibacter sp. WS9]ROZ69160.1 helix-turn-helix domain-containing protein [Ramlibacter sp. WS9]
MSTATDSASAPAGAEGQHPGATLRRAREAAGWSQRELASRAGVHQPQVARAESGQDVQLSLLARLAAPLGLAPGLLAVAPPPGSSPASAAAALHDTVADSFESWRQAWPSVNPEAFAVQTRLLRAGRHAEAAIEHSAKGHGITSGDLVVLGTLRRINASFEATPTELKGLLWISLPGLKKRLDRLHERGLVSRRENPRDARGLIVALTPRGKNIVDTLVRSSAEPLWLTLLETPPADLAQLSGLLRSLLARVEVRLGGQGKPL